MKKHFWLLIYIIFFSCKQDNYTQDSTKIKKIDKKKYESYNKNGKLDKVLEYVNLCGKEYLNQGWYFNNNGDTLYGKSNFYKIDIEKKELKPNEISKVSIQYVPLMKNSINVLFISKTNIDADYCNLHNAKLDTIYFVNNKLEFNLGFKSKGKVVVGGYILEISKERTKVNNKNVYSERKVYFNIPFEIGNVPKDLH